MFEMTITLGGNQIFVLTRNSEGLIADLEGAKQCIEALIRTTAKPKTQDKIINTTDTTGE